MTRKVLISIDERLLRTVDEAAKALGLSRSRFLCGLAQREVGSLRRSPEEQREIGEAMGRLRELSAHGPAGDEPSEVTIRRMRDERTAYLGRRGE